MAVGTVLSVRIFSAAALALGVIAGSASAQTRTRESTPFVIHQAIVAGPEIGVEATAPRGQALIVQHATSIRAARLEADTPSLAGFRKTKTFPAGSSMFGIYAGSGWAYCAVAETSAAWWSGDEFVCYEDADQDGRFETAMHSGSPFLGVPLFVFELGRKQTLPEPAPYVIAPADAGPAVDYVVTAQVQRPRLTDPAATPVVIVTLKGGFRQSVNSIPTAIGGWTAGAPLKTDGPTRISLMGAEIDILGVDDDNTVRYRVVSATPTQVQRIVMGVTTTTTLHADIHSGLSMTPILFAAFAALAIQSAEQSPLAAPQADAPTTQAVSERPNRPPDLG